MGTNEMFTCKMSNLQTEGISNIRLSDQRTPNCQNDSSIINTLPLANGSSFNRDNCVQKECQASKSQNELMRNQNNQYKLSPNPQEPKKNERIDNADFQNHKIYSNLSSGGQREVSNQGNVMQKQVNTTTKLDAISLSPSNCNSQGSSANQNLKGEQLEVTESMAVKSKEQISESSPKSTSCENNKEVPILCNNQDLNVVNSQNHEGTIDDHSEESQPTDKNSFYDILDYCNDEDDDSDDPSESLEISCSTLSYERFFPGRILGNTFTIKNVGYKACTFQLSFENSNIDSALVKEKMQDYYNCETFNQVENTFTKHLKSKIDNSEENLSVWYFEDPYTKRLTKNVEMELESEDEYEFIVVLKSPSINKQTLFAANAIINNFSNQTQQKIFLFGCMERCKLSCPKELHNLKLNSKMIKVIMKRNQTMPIKLLLENKGDMQIIGNFQSIEMDKSIQFYFPREKLIVDSNSRAILEIKAVHKSDSEGSCSNIQNKPEIIHKLVIAKIKDCEFKYSLIFEITVV